MKKCRIIERISPNGRVLYVIQQKHFLFFWLWVDAWENSMDGAYCRDSWDTLEEAQANLCHFDGTRFKEKVIIQKQMQ